ncbi:IS3 family transposase [Emticicia sp. 17c]|uniref:IS3 family transposase n=1 Tax=Emticicia sp. 17c TaxID=3127704 RepID=UPI00301E58BD
MFGIDRQVYYRSIRRKRIKQDKASEVIKLIEDLRIKMPRIGTRKMYYLLNEPLRRLKIGRDRFFDILRANHLLIQPKRSYRITTNSHHRFRKHKNLIDDLTINRPEQVWVSDITYIGRRDKPCYLSLITDAYSKKIVGYYVADNLNTESSINALKMAIKQRSNRQQSLIHHSDRGLQYCSDDYQKLLKKNQIKCSMTQNSDPYENAIAERVNGILKQEFSIDKYSLNLKLIKQIVKESIEIYNNIRPHLSNYLLTPRQMHNQNKLIIKSYKSKSSRNQMISTA